MTPLRPSLSPHSTWKSFTTELTIEIKIYTFTTPRLPLRLTLVLNDTLAHRRPCSIRWSTKCKVSLELQTGSRGLTGSGLEALAQYIKAPPRYKVAVKFGSRQAFSMFDGSSWRKRPWKIHLKLRLSRISQKPRLRLSFSNAWMFQIDNLPLKAHCLAKA